MRFDQKVVSPCTGCPKNPATLIEFQSIPTRLKLNIFERFENQKNRADSAVLQRGSFGF